MDASDVQQHRHMARTTALGLAIFYREQRRVGMPWLLAILLTVEHYRYLLRDE